MRLIVQIILAGGLAASMIILAWAMPSDSLAKRVSSNEERIRKIDECMAKYREFFAAASNNVLVLQADASQCKMIMVDATNRLSQIKNMIDEYTCELNGIREEHHTWCWESCYFIFGK